MLTLMVTESNRNAQQVISSKLGNVSTLLKNWTRITVHEMKVFLSLYSKYEHHQKANQSIILVHSLFPSHPMVWENVH
jgi:hypothetical protein